MAAYQKLTRQQARNYSAGSMTGDTPVDLDAFRERIVYYFDRPIEFVREIIGVEPDDWQCQALIAIRDHTKVGIASCTGAGKTAVAAWAILWYLVTRPMAIVPCTAPNARLLGKVLWKELAIWIDHSRFLPHILEWNAETVKHRHAPNKWFAYQQTTVVKKGAEGGGGQAEGIAGAHSDFMLLVIDEASGVQNEHFESTEGTMTGFENKLLVIGNPLRTEGRFFEIFHKPRIARHWVTFNVAALPGRHAKYISSRANRSGNAQKLVAAYGEDSAYVISRVFGEFPLMGAVDVVFSVSELNEAMMRDYEPVHTDEVQIGVDCARYGDDKTVYTVRRGWKITRVVEQGKSPANKIIGTVAELIEQEATITYLMQSGMSWKEAHAGVTSGAIPTQSLPESYHPTVVIDEAEGGGGGGTCDLLWAQGYTTVIGVTANETASEPEKYANVASEMWIGTLKEFFPRLDMSEIAADVDDDADMLDELQPVTPGEMIKKQLISRKYEFTGKGPQRRIEPKEKYKRRTGYGSPDHADSLCLSVYRPAIPGVI